MRLRGGYEGKLFEFIMCKSGVRNSLEIYLTARSILSSRGNVCEQALNVEGYHVFSLHGELLYLPYISTVFRWNVGL